MSLATYDFVARLPGHVLKFNKRSNDRSGKGNIAFTSEPTDCVWGVVIDVPDEDKHLLDNAEGLGKGYDEQEVEVYDLGGAAHRVQAYVAAASHIDDSLKPYSWYLGLVVRGATARGLSTDYVRWLGSFESWVDSDPARSAKADQDCE